MTHAGAVLTRSKPWRLGLLLVALTLVWLAAVGGGTAQAWYCKPSGIYSSWQHWSHNSPDFTYHDYRDGHTHSNGEHHHIWYVFGGSSAGYRHVNCGTVFYPASAAEY